MNGNTKLFQKKKGSILNSKDNNSSIYNQIIQQNRVFNYKSKNLDVSMDDNEADKTCLYQERSRNGVN